MPAEKHIWRDEVVTYLGSGIARRTLIAAVGSSQTANAEI